MLLFAFFWICLAGFFWVKNNGANELCKFLEIRIPPAYSYVVGAAVFYDFKLSNFETKSLCGFWGFTFKGLSSGVLVNCGSC